MTSKKANSSLGLVPGFFGMRVYNACPGQVGTDFPKKVHKPNDVKRARKRARSTPFHIKSMLAAMTVMAKRPDQVTRPHDLRLRVKNLLVERVAVPDQGRVEIGPGLRRRLDVPNRLLRPGRCDGHEQPGAKPCDCHSE